MGALGLRRTRHVEVEDAASGLAVAEYTSIRAESIQSFATSQSIIQWSLATYGVLFGAGLLAVNSEIASDLAPSVSWMAALIYGVLLPGLVCAAAWSWIGEIRRMERAGAYVRGIERHLRLETRRGTASVVGPLNWETFLAGSQRSASSGIKGWAPYLGTALLFGGSLFSSVVFFFFWVYEILDDGWNDGVWALLLADAALVVLFLVVCLHTGMGVVWLGSQFFDLEKEELRRWRPGLSLATYRVIEVALVVTMIVALVGLATWLMPERILTWK
ncbi:hypothetical protein [Agromyces sp. ZXT2-3]|uniref:hypothetical protein n=1 Tax=Agromyces sp. ZXT2-3 TaxID=3461152 RepID=UPI0040551749